MQSSHNKTKKIWQIINKETGSSWQDDYLTSLKNGSEKTFNPQKMANMLSSFFIASVEDLLVNNINHYSKQSSQLSIKYQMNSMFRPPITEMEREKVVKFTRKTLCRLIPEYLAKRCLYYIKKPLVHIFNASLKSGVFLEKMKIAKLRPLYKKGGKIGSV
jgi:hypothetical protein